MNASTPPVKVKSVPETPPSTMKSPTVSAASAADGSSVNASAAHSSREKVCLKRLFFMFSLLILLACSAMKPLFLWPARGPVGDDFNGSAFCIIVTVRLQQLYHRFYTQSINQSRCECKDSYRLSNRPRQSKTDPCGPVLLCLRRPILIWFGSPLYAAPRGSKINEGVESLVLIRLHNKRNIC
ncbi:MAG: hypothetical protein BWY35_01045 [Firmicutes bacterium ADurb.Bin248]|nr:MAG: hypothetical protein BWY35_01045 [Firmicutes bacterium ADurb.Bin248]